MQIRGIHGQNFSNETQELIAVWSRAPMIYRSGSWEKAPITLTNDKDAYFDSFLNGAFMVNGNDPNYYYDGSFWYSNGLNTADSPISKYIKEHNTRIYLYGITIAGVEYPDWCWMSDLPKNGQITWGLETGSDLVQTASSAVVTSVGSLFKTRNIKVGDPLTITAGANTGEYVVQSIDSETQITLTENLNNTVTGAFWVGGNYFPVSTEDGDIGMGLGETSNELFLYKKNSVYRYNDRGQELRRIKNMPGTTSPRSIISDGDYVYAYHPSGIYRTEGVNEQLLTNSIEDIINGVTTANQSLVVGWKNKQDKTLNWYVGDVTTRDGDSIKNCIIVFDTNSNTISFKSYDRVIKCAMEWLHNDVLEIYGGDDDGGVLQLDTGTSFNGNAIPFELEYKPFYPAGSEAVVDFERERLYVRNGLDVQIMFKLYYKPQRGDKDWIIDKDWQPMIGSQKGDRSEWDYPTGSTASGVKLKIIESSKDESFLIEKRVPYWMNPSNR